MTGSTEARWSRRSRGSPLGLPCGAAQRTVGRGRGEVAHGYAATHSQLSPSPGSRGWPAHLGRHRNRSGPCQERRGLTQLAQSKGLGQGLWGCLPGPQLVPESRRTSSGAGKAAPPRQLLLPSASLVPSACGHVAAACDSGCCALVQTGPRLREAGPGALGVSGGATAQGLQVAPPRSPGAAGVRVRGLGTDTP